MNQTELLKSLGPDSLRVFTQKLNVRLDQSAGPETEQTYLTFDGTPEASIRLATLLNQMAENALESKNVNGVIVSPSDLDQLNMTEWSSIELTCCQRNED